MSEQQAQFNGYAKVEIMGHQSHVGYVRTEAYGQAVMFRIDTPELPEREYVLEEPAYVDGRWTAAGAKVLRPAKPGHSVLVGAGSVYRIIPCDEATAMRAIEKTAPELKLVSLPESKALAAAADTEPYEGDDTEPDDEPREDDPDPDEDVQF